MHEHADLGLVEEFGENPAVDPAAQPKLDIRSAVDRLLDLKPIDPPITEAQVNLAFEGSLRGVMGAIGTSTGSSGALSTSNSVSLVRSIAGATTSGGESSTSTS